MAFTDTIWSDPYLNPHGPHGAPQRVKQTLHSTLRRVKRVAIKTLSVGLVGGLLVFVGVNGWIWAHVRGRLHSDMSTVPVGYEVAIVLGAHVEQGGRPSDSLADRLQVGLELYQEGRVTRILVTGDNGPRSQHETDIMRAWLVERGVPPDAIWVDPYGIRTFDSMVRAAKVFGITRAIVCTQAFHLPRSVYLARMYGIDAIGLMADRHTYKKIVQFWVREQGARALSVLDVHVLDTQPIRGFDP